MEGDVIYGDGVVARPDGTAVFNGTLHRGTLDESWFGNGFTDPQNAEVHLVINQPDHFGVTPVANCTTVHNHAALTPAQSGSILMTETSLIPKGTRCLGCVEKRISNTKNPASDPLIESYLTNQ